jgi:phage gp36-like protein
MAYATFDDLLKHADRKRLVDLTDRGDPPDGQIDTDLVARALEHAGAQIDLPLSARYAVPLSPVPAVVRHACVVIAFHDLHIDTAPDKVVEDARRVFKWLDDIAAGRQSLPGVPASGASGAGRVLFRAAPRVWDRDSLTDFVRIGRRAGQASDLTASRGGVRATTDDFQTEAAEPLLAGHCIHFDATGRLMRSRAHTPETAAVVGVIVADAAVGESARWRLVGRVDRADWSVITEDGAARLQPGADYFLSANLPGRITRVPPAGAGQFVTFDGTAASTTVLAADPATPIAL